MIRVEVGYPDEPFWGCVGRHMRMIPPRARERRRSPISGNTYLGLPGRIEEAVQHLFHFTNLRSIDVLWKMTDYPAVAPFLSSEIRNTLADRMLYGTSSKGLGSHTVGTMYLREERMLLFCRQCRAIDLRHFPHSWWRRSHHIKGVCCCAVHKCALEVSQFPMRKLIRSEYPLVDEAISMRKTMEPDAVDVFVAEQFDYLLNANSKIAFDRDAIRRVYWERIEAMGFTNGDRYRANEIHAAFRRMRSEAEWLRRGIDLSGGPFENWPIWALRCDPFYKNALPQILAMKFLDLNFKDAVDMAARLKERPFCPAPNPKAELLRMAKESMRKWWNDPFLIFNDICRLAKLEPALVRSIARELQLPILRHACPAEYQKRLKKRAWARGEAIKQIKRGEQVEMRIRRWLRAWDLEWFIEKIPQSKTRKQIKRSYAEREESSLNRLPYICAWIRARRPFIRVSVNAIRNRLGLNAPMKEQMPRLFRAIEDACENHLDFAVRRIAVLKVENPGITPWMLRQLSATADRREPEVMRALGYRLRGGIWRMSDDTRKNYGIPSR